MDGNFLLERFNTKKYADFVIENFELNKPLNIMYNNKYLSYPHTTNKVDFWYEDDNSGRQKWIIEKQDENYYIRGVFERYNGTQYLGCPNSNNNVFLYTSKNRFTQWDIIPIGENKYKILYIGEKFNTKEISIVIARYMENVEWALAYNDIAIIYNKSEYGDISEIFEFETNSQYVNYDLYELQNIVNLPNVGREGHTYLHHMESQQNNLTERVVFVQANPFDHNHTLLFGIDNYEFHAEVQPMGLQYLLRKNLPPVEVVNKYKTMTIYGLEYMIMHMNSNFNTIEKFHDKGIESLNIIHKKIFKTDDTIVQGFLNRTNLQINKPTNIIRFSLCGLFSLSKKKILQHNPEIYKILNETLLKDTENMIEGYILERLWMYIFE
jgi:hypothetical protein